MILLRSSFSAITTLQSFADLTEFTLLNISFPDTACPKSFVILSLVYGVDFSQFVSRPNHFDCVNFKSNSGQFDTNHSILLGSNIYH